MESVSRGFQYFDRLKYTMTGVRRVALWPATALQERWWERSGSTAESSAAGQACGEARLGAEARQALQVGTRHQRTANQESCRLTASGCQAKVLITQAGKDEAVNN